MGDPTPSPRLRDLPADARAAALGLGDERIAALHDGLSLAQADHMIENVIGVFGLPLGVAQHFVVNGCEIAAVPMAIEEASVVAACSYAAKLARASGGFTAGSSEPIMIGQVQLMDVPDIESARARLAAEAKALIGWLNYANPSTRSRHARAVGLETRALAGDPPMLIAHILYDCGDAMGANLINTACEAIAPRLEQLSGGRANLRILSNLSDRRMAWATCTIRADLLAARTDNPAPATEVVARIVEASLFAERDPYRAATHNKGIMNGVDAVVIATGNDWRAVEAAAHAYAARDGRYTALATWRADAEGNLVGRIELPLAVGIVGGATRVHPVAQVALELLGVKTARELAEIIACVGLAQNFAAVRALAMEGIQQGHMALHARQIAIAAGARGEEVERIAAQLVAERNVRLERARALINRDPSLPA
ncbi:MAG: hydroxymethylglutaryl-CoA reductase, degradative [Anaerolineae bacterium]|nr:hydroxymethylglutaryl-CoA reductase, degradative [Anaerolineae bacterium]